MILFLLRMYVQINSTYLLTNEQAQATQVYAPRRAQSYDMENVGQWLTRKVRECSDVM